MSDSESDSDLLDAPRDSIWKYPQDEIGDEIGIFKKLVYGIIIIDAFCKFYQSKRHNFFQSHAFHVTKCKEEYSPWNMHNTIRIDLIGNGTYRCEYYRVILFITAAYEECRLKETFYVKSIDELVEKIKQDFKSTYSEYACYYRRKIYNYLFKYLCKFSITCIRVDEGKCCLHRYICSCDYEHVDSLIYEENELSFQENNVMPLQIPLMIGNTKINTLTFFVDENGVMVLYSSKTIIEYVLDEDKKKLYDITKFGNRHVLNEWHGHEIRPISSIDKQMYFISITEMLKAIKGSYNSYFIYLLKSIRYSNDNMPLLFPTEIIRNVLSYLE